MVKLINYGDTLKKVWKKNLGSFRRMVNVDLSRNMAFEIKNSFIPNFTQSETLRILEVTDASVVIQMDKSGSRGVFPIDHFQYWIKKSSLIPMEEQQEKTS